MKKTRMHSSTMRRNRGSGHFVGGVSIYLEGVSAYLEGGNCLPVWGGGGGLSAHLCRGGVCLDTPWADTLRQTLPSIPHTPLYYNPLHHTPLLREQTEQNIFGKPIMTVFRSISRGPRGLVRVAA